jgi:hypothetical protein
MPETHTVGHHYWHWFRYPELRHLAGMPPVPRWGERPVVTAEIEMPYRAGTGRLYRLWPTRFALVIGCWDGQSAGDMAAVGGRDMGLDAEEVRALLGPEREPEEVA